MRRFAIILACACFPFLMCSRPSDTDSSQNGNDTQLQDNPYGMPPNHGYAFREGQPEAQTTDRTEVGSADRTEIRQESGNPAKGWALTAFIIAIATLAATGVSFFFAKNVRDTLLEKNERRKRAIDVLTKEIEDRLGGEVARQRREIAQMRTELQLMSDNLSQLKEEAEERRQKEADPSPEEVPEGAAPASYVPKTFFGVFKPRFNGLLSDELTDHLTPGSTIRLVTESPVTAQVYLVDNVDKTQFAFLYEATGLVTVMEGNPQEYSSISIVEPGQAELEEDCWVIRQSIKIRLS